MPIYEYRCEDCRATSSIRYGSFAQAATGTAVCASCGSRQMTRLVSRVAISRAGAARSEGSSSGAPRGSDPRALASIMREAAGEREMGAEFGEVAARLERGEAASSIEASLRRRVGEQPESAP